LSRASPHRGHRQFCEVGWNLIEEYKYSNPVELPKLGNTVEECILFRCALHPGDAVAVGDLVAEIETD
jgi:hypothetical protein